MEAKHAIAFFLRHFLPLFVDILQNKTSNVKQ